MRQHVCIAHPSIDAQDFRQQSSMGEQSSTDTAVRSMIPPSPHGLVLKKKVFLQRVLGTDDQDTINAGPPVASQLHTFAQHLKKTQFLGRMMTNYDAALGVSEIDCMHVKEKLNQITKSVR